MESSRAHSEQAEGEDRISKLSDGILLSILTRVNASTAVRAGILSTRWRHLPCLLPKLDIDVNEFLRDDYDATAERIDEAMSTLIKATSKLLAGERAITSLFLKFYLTSNYMGNLGGLLCDVIDTGKLESLELRIITEKSSVDCSDEDMKQHGQSLLVFPRACPNMYRCLTWLCLENVSFDKSDMDQLLSTCEQLDHLILIHCDSGYRSVWKIDAPHSKLNVLELYECRFERVELLCVPKLMQLYCKNWISVKAPFAFDFVPCLEELCLICAQARFQQCFKLSEMLGDVTSIHTLTMDFQGERIWILPEGKQLYQAFKNLRKLFIRNIFVEFKLLWTTALLEAAPSLEILGIKARDHACEEEDTRVYSERTNASWETFEFTVSEHEQLKRLEFKGFKGVPEQMGFVRAIMNQAVHLDTILLKDKTPCKECDALNNSSSSPKSRFPKNNDEQHTIIKKIRVGLSSRAQIIFE